MILVIVRSIGQAFHGPAMMAAMPLLVPEKHLLRINTLDQLLMSVASIGAPRSASSCTPSKSAIRSPTTRR